jgi:ribA/ribD-fused uncharacterized protein
MKDSLNANEIEINDLKTEQGNLRQCMNGINEKNKKMHTEIQKLKEMNERLIDRQEQLEDYSRRDNLKINGYVNGEENCERYIRRIMKHHLGLDDADSIPIARCHTLRHDSSIVIIRFELYKDRMRVWNSKKKLKHTKLVMREDFCPATEMKRQILFPYMIAARSHDKKAVLHRNKLIIDGQVYTTVNLPPYLPECQIETESHIFFHGRNSVFSNFYLSDTTVGNVKYNCNEQYFQAEFAKFHDNAEALNVIMKSKDPVEQKRATKHIKASPEWTNQAKAVMVAGVQAKFQDTDLADILKNTGNAQLVECNKYDTFWGNGLSLRNPNNDDPNKWTGSNELGKILTALRSTL